MKKLHFWNDTHVNQALDLVSAVEAGMSFSGISTDSRSVKEGDLFVALLGHNFDGHDFIPSAVKQGARGLVVSRSVLIEEEPISIFRVEDTLEALGSLARYFRRKSGVTVVAITGSSGKTGTKDLTQAAIEACHSSYCTRGNQNNRIGVPLTLLSAPENTDVIVLEMGTSEPGEIESLTTIAEPQIALITTVSESHTQGLESFDGVMEEKLKLFEGPQEGGTALVSGEPEILSCKAKEIVADTLVVGSGEHTDVGYRPEKINMDGSGHCSFFWRGERIELKVPGRHSVQNCLMALAVADLLDVPVKTAVKGVSRVEASGMRTEIMQVGGLTLILDCYNANPQSVEAGLDLLGSMDSGRSKIAFLGSMLELGKKSAALHSQVLSGAMSLKLDLVVATGLFTRGLSQEEGNRDSRIVSVADPHEAYQKIRDQIEGDEIILLKASREVRLEKLIPFFKSDFGIRDVSLDGASA